MRRIIFGGVAVVVAVLWPAGSAFAEGSGSPPVVKLVGPSPLAVHMTSSKGEFSASFSLDIENDGPELTWSQYTLAAMSDQPAESGAVLRITTPTDLQARTDTEVPVALTVADRTTTAITAVLTVSANDTLPSSQTLTLTRSPLSTNFLWIALASVGLGLVVFGWLTVTLVKMPRDKNVLWTPSTFSFSGSWVTSITSVVTAVAAVFATTGVLAALVPGIDSSAFVGSTIVYAFVLSLAPMVYSALMWTDPKVQNGTAFGTRTGFRIAAAITAVAFGGQLSTVGAVIALSDIQLGVRVGLIALLGVATVVMVLYVWKSGDQLSKLTLPTSPPASTGAAKSFTEPALGATTVFVTSLARTPPGLA